MAKILVVEDEANIRETLVDILESYDYDVVEAPNGLVGAVRTIKEKPDLILSDVNMPEMDGFEMLDSLRGCMEEALIPPFIFLTARTERSDMRKGMSLGADDYITKPFNTAELLEAVRVKLERRSEVANKLLKKERSQISGELHDSIQQLLVASYMGFQAIQDKISLLDPKDQLIFKSALGLLQQSNEDLRSYAHNIGKGQQIVNIETSLNSLANGIKTTGDIDIEVKCEIRLPLSIEVQTQLFRIVQEAISNILKHAKASKVTIELICDKSGSKLRVVDNGVGFDTSTASSGLGMSSLKDRVQQVKGTLQLNSEINKGTVIEITIEPNKG